MQTLKAKTPQKICLPPGPRLDDAVLRTVTKIADIVGSTLGPGGRPVLLERPEYGIAPDLTKDGVSVFRALGFADPVEHAICEAERDVATRTVAEAGDGPQPLWSRVLTPSGFVAMGDVRTGMQICGTNGTTQEILGVYPKGSKEVVKITFEQGQTVECCEDHLWSVITHYGLKKTLRVADMIGDYRIEQAGGDIRYRYFVPNTVVEFEPPLPAPLNPYLVGVLLGDGSLTDSGSIELSLGFAKEHILGRLGLPRTTVCQSSFRVKIANIRHLVNEIGLRNTDSSTKFIPKRYLHGTVEERQQLLQGLLDTDGHLNARGLFEFSTVSDRLADDFMFLCRSLGKIVCRRVHRRDGDEGSYSDRPIHRFQELKGNKYGLKISGIERTGRFTEMQCIKVSNPDQLYVTDDFVVTHNTTTATILAAAMTRRIRAYCAAHPEVPPQRVAQQVRATAADLRDTLRHLSVPTHLGTPEGDRLLRAVANISANGDGELADAVMRCFEIAGDLGNVTILETPGNPSGYRVSKIDGYPIDIGYEDGLGKLAAAFINRVDTQQVVLERPAFVLYFGAILDAGMLQSAMARLQDSWTQGYLKTPYIAVMATRWGDRVIEQLAHNWGFADSIYILPMTIPVTALANSQRQTLEDIAAIVPCVKLPTAESPGGVVPCTIFDPLNRPLADLVFDDIGNLFQDATGLWQPAGITALEVSRHRTMIVGTAYPDDTKTILDRIAQVELQKAQAASKLDDLWHRDRLAKLTDGIAQLTVIGASSGELRERRDRADDAICAVKAAVKRPAPDQAPYGCLPGGGWGLAALALRAVRGVEIPVVGAPRVSWDVDPASKDRNPPAHERFRFVGPGIVGAVGEVLAPALVEPAIWLLENAGYSRTEIEHAIGVLLGSAAGTARDAEVLDLFASRWVAAVKTGIVDSFLAVAEALTNAASIASVLGTLGGAVVQPRDYQIEREEASSAAEFKRMSEFNPADQRA